MRRDAGRVDGTGTSGKSCCAVPRKVCEHEIEVGTREDVGRVEARCERPWSSVGPSEG